ncbi:CBARP isoform 3 [Pongo abelii]|uniref:CBARP isoform 3 n=1 Tax=Pongo abelii TaxID=9601 RepID=A0A2J8R9U8_PONAB|nr:CBARP isoform 3 [Pongo abelii]
MQPTATMATAATTTTTTTTTTATVALTTSWDNATGRPTSQTPSWTTTCCWW